MWLKFLNRFQNSLCVLILTCNVLIEAPGKFEIDLLSFRMNRNFPSKNLSFYNFRFNVSEAGIPKSAKSIHFGGFPAFMKNIKFVQAFNSSYGIIWNFPGTTPAIMHFSAEVKVVDTEKRTLWANTFNGSFQGRQPHLLEKLRTDNGNTTLTFRVAKHCSMNFYGSECVTFCKSTKRYTCTDRGKKKCTKNWKNARLNCTEDVNECVTMTKPCQNGGKCKNTFGSYQCRCLHGFGGLTCEIAIHPCDLSPCRNRGSCIIRNSTDYECACVGGYTGVNCELHFDQCRLNPCVQSINCINNGSDYFCECKRGYEGKKCDVDINECLRKKKGKPLCKNNGTCVNKKGGYYCQCPIPYEGDDCLSLDKDYDVFAGSAMGQNYILIIIFAGVVVIILVILVSFCIKNLVHIAADQAYEKKEYEKRMGLSDRSETPSDLYDESARQKKVSNYQNLLVRIDAPGENNESAIRNTGRRRSAASRELTGRRLESSRRHDNSSSKRG